METPY